MLVYLTLAKLLVWIFWPIFYQFCCKCSKPGKDICLSYILIELWTQYKICFQIKAILYPTNQYPLDFSKTRHFNKHLRIHTGEIPYKCNQCPMDFSQNGSLKKHSRIHSGEKPYQCKECRKAFSQDGSLAIHLRIHWGEKPYPCNQCSKAVSLNQSLKNIWEFIQGRNHTHAIIVPKLSQIVEIWRNMW